MRLNSSTSTFFMLFISLLCIQVCSFSIKSPYLPNLLLVFLTYVLYQCRPLYQCFFILFGIELLSLLESGATGFNIIIATPLILNFLTVKTFLHLKLLAPAIFIFTYEMIHELSTSLSGYDAYSMNETCLRIVITYLLFLTVYAIWPTTLEQDDQGCF